MHKPAAKFVRALQPQSNQKAWLDWLVLAIFGLWFYGEASSPWLRIHPNITNYGCGGPGFVDFGCTGGYEAVIANIIHALIMIFPLTVSLVALARLLNRIKAKANA